MVARILAGTVIVALLAWLAIDGRTSATTLEDGLCRGAFGGLAPAEEGQLLELAVALLPVDRRQPRQIIINKVAPHTLRIFTFTEKASQLPGQKGEHLAGVAELVMTEQGQLEIGPIFTGRLPAKDLLPSFHVTVSPDGATMLAHGKPLERLRPVPA